MKKEITLLDLNSFLIKLGNANKVGFRKKVVLLKQYLKSFGA